MAENTAVVRVVNPHAEAAATIKELHRSGFDIDKLSIVGKDYHSKQQVIPTHNAYDRIKDWQELGAFWGNLWGLLLRSGFFFIPGIGPVIVFGPLASSIIRAREDAGMVSGLSALGAGLFSIGISKKAIMEYERALQSDKFIVIAHRTADEMVKTNSILETPGAARLLPVRVERRHPA
jgi:uncharacterized membrane protein